MFSQIHYGGSDAACEPPSSNKINSALKLFICLIILYTVIDIFIGPALSAIPDVLLVILSEAGEHLLLARVFFSDSIINFMAANCSLNEPNSVCLSLQVFSFKINSAIFALVLFWIYKWFKPGDLIYYVGRVVGRFQSDNKFDPVKSALALAFGSYLVCVLIALHFTQLQSVEHYSKMMPTAVFYQDLIAALLYFGSYLLAWQSYLLLAQLRPEKFQTKS